MVTAAIRDLLFQVCPHFAAEIGLAKETSDPQSVSTIVAVMVTAVIRDLLFQVCPSLLQKLVCRKKI